MMQKSLLVSISLLLATAGGALAGAAEDFLQELSGKVAEAEANGQRVFKGLDGWLFFVGELRSISVGPFWGAAAAKVSRASRLKNADPLPAIVEFNEQCKQAGVELILLPVPAKAVIYPDKVLGAVQLAPDGKPPRMDIYQQQFYALLKERGVEVLDLTDVFLEQRFDEAGNMYCKHDTHWSSKACRLAASLIMARVKDRPWLKTVTKTKVVSEEKPLKITGDLWDYLKDQTAETETLPMVFAGEPGLKFLASDRNSPVVLIGDSHTLVFNAGGDLHTRGAGLADHLALEFGFAVDQIGMRGSGTTAPRADLARRKDDLKGKKLVVWCFASRQFTESVNGWMTGLPVVK